MKKIFFLLSMFVLFSCEQEDLNSLVDNSRAKTEQPTVVKSRAASTIADFDPIAELNGIQVNIINMGSGSKSYLSCVKDGSGVDLYDRDDGSQRQRWYIGNGTIKLVGGNKTYEGQDAFIGPCTPRAEETSPVLQNVESIIGQPSVVYCGNFRYISDDLVIEKIPQLFPPSGFGSEPSYLQRKSEESSTLLYKKGNNDMSTHWRLELVGDYDFVDMRYIKTAGDYVTLEAPYIRSYEFYNKGKPEPGEGVFQLNETVQYTSQFSETKTVSISRKVSVNSTIGVPAVVNGNISSETTTTYGWSYTTSGEEKRTMSITDTYKYVVPADKDVQMNVYIASYKMNLTYIMTVRRRYDGKIFRVKGKWEGVQCTNLKFVAKDLYTGEFLSQTDKTVNATPIN